MQSDTLAKGVRKKTGRATDSFWHLPDITIARLVLASYLRSGWMWAEFVLVLVFFAAFYFPFPEKTSDFNGTSNFFLGAIAILGPAVMVRQATSARTYMLLARLTSRATYSRGLMLASAFLRIPLYLFFLGLVLLLHRLTDPTAEALFWGAVGIIPNTILVATLTISLCSPMAIRLHRIYFLAWLALVLFSSKPIFPIPSRLEGILSISQIPLWPLVNTYIDSASGNIDLSGLLSLCVIAAYCIILALVAGRGLEKRELLLH